MNLAGKHIHFMGIGGIGVSALALMARDAGATVSGCDRSANDLTRKLAGQGIDIRVGHHPDHVAGVDLLVHTAAVPPEHPERFAAGEHQEKRGRFLARFMDSRLAIGVSGTHGKTTTTSLLTQLLVAAGRDPMAFIGGIVPSLPEGNFRLGNGPFVAELDESDASFLLPRLKIAVVTNIESDHLSHYHTDAALFAAFDQYAAGVADDGLLIAGLDSPAADGLYGRHQGCKLGFGFGEDATVRAGAVQSREGGGSLFTLFFRGENLGEFAISLPGRHNVANALAALAAALELGVQPEVLRAALPQAEGVERRMEWLATIDGADLYSDYAHHPTEMTAAIAALRARYAGRPVLVVFQPHLYTRTRDYATAFGQALAGADSVVLVDIYPAREEPIPGVDSGLLLRETLKARPDARVAGPFPLARTGGEVLARAGEYAAVVMMGAGDIDDVARQLAAEAHP